MTNPLYERLFGRHAGQATRFLHLADGTSVTHGDFLRQAARIAHALVAFGVAPGDRVAAQVDKSPAALALYAACVQSGAVFLPLNTGYTVQELRYFLEDSAARLVISDGAKADALRPITDALGAALQTLNANGTGTLTAQAATLPDTFKTVARTNGDLTALLYTSGTTGRSKGAMLTQDNLLSNAETLAEYWRFTDRDVLLHALPIFHTHGLFVASNVSLIAGGAMIFLPGFDPDAMIAQMPRATTMMGVPTFYTRLLADPRFDRALTGHMRLFFSGSAPLLADTHAQFEQRTGHRILERYGMTETNMNTSNPYDGDRRAGTVGFPLPGVEVTITDPVSGVPVAPGETGQIEVRGANVFKGYWRMPDKTAEELRETGFFITGDLGRVDADGYVHIVGRAKDVIISGGYNIYPKEIELLLDDQPGVLESAVIGVPHPDFGETPVGLIVADPGTVPDLEKIDAALSDLARFKRPRRLILVPKLPRNTMGKVQKNQLRATYGDMFQPT